MNLKEYLKLKLGNNKQPDLSMIYQDLINLGYKPIEIYQAINEQIEENIINITLDYYKKKNENK
jgi:hypothetical protein